MCELFVMTSNYDEIRAQTEVATSDSLYCYHKRDDFVCERADSGPLQSKFLHSTCGFFSPDAVAEQGSANRILDLKYNFTTRTFAFDYALLRPSSGPGTASPNMTTVSSRDVQDSVGNEAVTTAWNPGLGDGSNALAAHDNQTTTRPGAAVCQKNRNNSGWRRIVRNFTPS